MSRLADWRRSKLDSLDLVVCLALAVVPFSYYLGLDMDWSEGSLLAGQQEAFINAGRGGGSAGSSAPDSLAAIGSAASGAQDAGGLDAAPWDGLVRKLESAASAHPGRVAIYLKDLRNDRVWSLHPDDLFPSASLIKVPIMAGVFDRIHHGELSLQTTLSLRRRHRTGGSGSLKWYRDGATFTVRELLTKLIDESDNTAMRILIEAVGLGYLQQLFPRMGLSYTEIYPEGLSLKSTRVASENYTTAREMSALLEKIYKGEMVDGDSSALMLDILKRRRVRSRLAKGLPAGWQIAHKTGLLRRACHDAAVIFSPRGDYILTVLTGENRDYDRAKSFIAKLGLLTYQFYRGDQGFYARVPKQGSPAGSNPRPPRHPATAVD